MPKTKLKCGIKLSIIIFLLFHITSPLVIAETQQPVKVAILFFNDIHGHLQPFNVKTDKGTQQVGGMARIASMIKKIRTENTNKGIKTIVLVAGDILQGTPMSTVFKGKPDIQCLNKTGVDAMTVGNHEFDFGLQNFLDLNKTANFPFLSANIIWKKDKQPLCESSISFELCDDLFLTIIGATTRELLVTTKPENVTDLLVLDPVTAVKNRFDQVKTKGPVILLSHNRHKTDRAIADAIPELSAIIAGHDQILFSPFRKAGNVPVFQAFEKGRYLGRIDIDIDPMTKKAMITGDTYLPVTANIEADPEIEEIVNRYLSRLDKKFKKVIGYSETFLDGERDRIRFKETTLGNFVTDIMRECTGADIALLNAGSLRSSINSGPVMVEDVFRAMPYSNEIVIAELSGHELLQVLTRSVMGNQEDEDGGFLQVSGICFSIKNHNLQNISIGDDRKPLDSDKTYTLAITDYIASGGDGYNIFTTKPMIKTGTILWELVVDTIRERKTISAKIENRIIRIKKWKK